AHSFAILIFSVYSKQTAEFDTRPLHILSFKIITFEIMYITEHHKPFPVKRFMPCKTSPKPYELVFITADNLSLSRLR
ncbi:MAG: hypothetical protein LBH00_03970, partial [Planctomycetaceae bacterium]|nr:hypothetical protein [Planctomycetaceae bacterium]